VQNPWRRAGALSGTIGRLIVVTIAAALLVAGVTLPFVGVLGIGTRDAANTFNDLQVGTLGQVPTLSTMYDVEGQPIAHFYPGDVYRQPVSYKQIAPVMRNAIVAIEDDTFYKQGALDPRGTLRALFSDSSGSQLQGASTLAQQYVKNVKVLQAGSNRAEADAAIYPDLSRKIIQLRIAADVEQEMTQDQLLAAYLNVAYFENEAYGIQVAAERYFSVPASRLTLPEAAQLAGMVQQPSKYDPVLHPDAARARRNEVLNRMAQLHYISQATATAAEDQPTKLKMSAAPLQTGCESTAAATVHGAFFCDYVQHVLEINDPSVWNEITTTGGLDIYTTLNMRDQMAAENAVDYVEPRHSETYNPGHNADTEVLIQPGTGAVRAIAINRKYGNGPGEDSIDYAVNAPYGGGEGVQTGSSSKIFTLITALEQGYPLGHSIKITAPAYVGPYYDCQNGYVAPAFFHNSEGPSNGTQVWMMNQALVDSINLYFVNLEKQVGLCSVVRTAVRMGMTRVDGTSLLKKDGGQPPADQLPSFTLGAVDVSPMSMAAAYASVAANGRYCSPQAITKVVVQATGKTVLVPSRHCHRDMPAGVAEAANYILQGVLSVPGATAYGQGIGRPAAGKTGTSDGGYYAAFAGYTPTLAGYVSVFSPVNPTGSGAMVGSNSDYQAASGGLSDCGGQMYGACAPASTWQMTFLHAQLGRALSFAYPPPSFFSEGNGLGAPTTVSPKRHHHPGQPPQPGHSPPPVKGH
jgi:membrane peptidoglycan carboxypeptidase